MLREEAGHIIEGILHCQNADCLREFPIIDGIPLIIAHIREYIADNILAICGRRDLSEAIESMLGDCSGPGCGNRSWFDVYDTNYQTQSRDPFANNLEGARFGQQDRQLGQQDRQFNAQLGQNNQQFNSTFDFEKWRENYRRNVTDPWEQQYRTLGLL